MIHISSGNILIFLWNDDINLRYYIGNKLKGSEKGFISLEFLKPSFVYRCMNCYFRFCWNEEISFLQTNHINLTNFIFFSTLLSIPWISKTKMIHSELAKLFSWRSKNIETWLKDPQRLVWAFSLMQQEFWTNTCPKQFRI